MTTMDLIVKPEDMGNSLNKLEECLSKIKERFDSQDQDQEYYHIAIVGEYNRKVCDEVEKLYTKVGWYKVKCSTSSENGERPGLTGLHLYKSDNDILPPRWREEIQAMMDKYPETAWWGDKSPKGFWSTTSPNHVVVFEKGIKGPAEHFIFKEDGMVHGNYTGYKDKHTLQPFKDLIVKAAHHNLNWK